VDVEDIGLQLLEQIYGERFKPDDVKLSAASIVVADNLTPRQFLALDRSLLKGLVLEHAGTTSHVVILARSFNIPTLTGVPDVRASVLAGREVIVDANLGILVTEITPAIQRYYERERRKLRRRQARFAPYTRQSATTRDGRRLEVAANVSTAQEVAPAVE